MVQGTQLCSWRYSVLQILQDLSSSVLEVSHELETEVFQLVAQPEGNKEHKALQHFKKGKINDHTLKKIKRNSVTPNMNILW